jgi:predicted ATPase
MQDASKTAFEHIRLYSLGSCSELRKALGVAFPRHPTMPRIAWLLAQTKRKLGKISDEDILNLPAMTEQSKLMSMCLICIIAVYALLLCSPLFPLLAMRLVRMTVKHGVSTMSAPAFGFWGKLLCNFLGDIPGGVRYARLSLALWESQNKSREWQSRVLVFSHGCGLIWTELTLRSTRADETGLKSGDIECGFLAAVGTPFSRRPIALCHNHLF